MIADRYNFVNNVGMPTNGKHFDGLDRSCPYSTKCDEGIYIFILPLLTLTL